MTTPIRTAKALEWAIKEGFDNNRICSCLDEDIPPHVAIYLPPSEHDFPPVTPDHVGYVYDNNELTNIIFIYEL